MDEVEKELRYTKGLVETLRTRIVKSEQEVLRLKIRVRRLETMVKELGGGVEKVKVKKKVEIDSP